MTARDFELLDEEQATELLCSRFRRLTDAGYDCAHALVLADGSVGATVPVVVDANVPV
jgi:hypothetical protein